MVVPSNKSWDTIHVEGLFILFFLEVALVLYVIYCIIKGNTYLHPRGMFEGMTVTREETPAGFWMIVGVFLVFGLLCVILSGYYIIMR
jgi:hypothetical protein